MAGLRIAAAQSASIPGDIEANVRRHCAFIDAAASVGTQLLVFPELSLTGYDLQGLAANAITVDDARLDRLRERAASLGMTIIAGLPLSNRAGLPSIGAAIFHADGRTSAYRKHFLYDGEPATPARGRRRRRHLVRGQFGHHAGRPRQPGGAAVGLR